MATNMITSKSNPRVQNLRTLINHRRDRESSGLFVIEGVRLLEEASDRSVPIEEVYFSQSLSDRGKVLIEKFIQKGVTVEEIDEAIFHQLMDTSTSQGIAAVCRKEIPVLPHQIHFGIIVDQLRDPGNLGTLLRVAAAAGAQAVIVTAGSVDLYSPKVLRSAMGAHFHTICLEMDWEQITQIRETNQVRPTTFVAAADADLVCWDCNFVQPTFLIIGNEAQGASLRAFEFADHKVSIPMPGQFESLNAAVAAGILIFEVVRQRSTNKKT